MSLHHQKDPAVEGCDITRICLGQETTGFWKRAIDLEALPAAGGIIFEHRMQK